MNKMMLVLVLTIIVVFAGCIGEFIYRIYSAPNNIPSIQRVSDFLSELKSQGYVFIEASQYNGTQPFPKTAIIFHDCDFNISGLPKLIALETTLGIKSSIYVRPNTEYFESSITYLQSLQSEGWQIGYHYDCLSKANNNYTLATEIFLAQLTLMREFLNITTARPHGDYTNLEILNGNLYNATLWKQLGLQEINSLLPSSMLYISDSNDVLTLPQTPINNNLVVMLFHSDWY